MRAPLDRIDVVAIRDDHFADRFVVLQSDFNFNGTLLVSSEEDDRWMYSQVKGQMASGPTLEQWVATAYTNNIVEQPPPNA